MTRDHAQPAGGGNSLSQRCASDATHPRELKRKFATNQTGEASLHGPNLRTYIRDGEGPCRSVSCRPSRQLGQARPDPSGSGEAWRGWPPPGPRTSALPLDAEITCFPTHEKGYWFQWHVGAEINSRHLGGRRGSACRGPKRSLLEAATLISRTR
jgi:hypothetical protein